MLILAILLRHDNTSVIHDRPDTLSVFGNSDLVIRGAIIPSDSYFNKQWYLQKIRAVPAWNISNDSKRIIIAVIDSGIQIDHPDLVNNIWTNSKEKPGNGIDDDKNGFIDDIHGWDFVSNNADPHPKFESGWTLEGLSHGTVVAGIIAASGNNAAGVVGISWQAQIMALRVLNDRGLGKINDVVRAIDYAVNNGADIINLSFNSFDYSQSMNEAIRRAYKAGVIVVAAAGNEADDNQGYNLDNDKMYPVCYDGPAGENWVIGVAAVDTLDQKAPFSSFGNHCIDIAAPGVSIFSTAVYSPNHSYATKPLDKYYDGYWSGTSVATPMVSGALALIEAMNPKYNRKQTVRALLENSDNINKLNPKYMNLLGAGRLNLENSLNRAKIDLERTPARIVTAGASGATSTVKIFDLDGNFFVNFEAYPKFRGGVNLAAGDVDGDGKAEIITAPAAGGGPHLRIFDSAGVLRAQFLVNKKDFRGGVNLAAGDVDGDGKAEIITAGASTDKSTVRVYDNRGRQKNVFVAFKEYPKLGVNLAAGDVDGDGKAEIITAPAAGGKPQIRIYNSAGTLKRQFMAFDDRFRGGVNLAAADFDGKLAGRRAEIIVAPAGGGAPQVRVFDQSGRLRKQFSAYANNFRGGIVLAAGDVNKDGFSEVITGAGSGGAPHTRSFDFSGKLIGGFYAYNENYLGGLKVAAVENTK